MLKSFLIVLLLCMSTSLMASVEVVIECGDTHPAYVNMDLTDDFKSEFLTSEIQKEYKTKGYNYFFAGRNCGKGRWDSNETYQVLFIMEDKGIFESRLDFFGSFSINGSTLKLSLPSEEVLLNGLVLTGNHRSELTGSSDSSISGVLESKRGRGKAKVIIIKE